MIKRYTLEKRPNLKCGDSVKVDMSFFGGSTKTVLSAKVIGLASEYIIDYWIVDFGKMLNEYLEFQNYPYQAMSIPHVSIVDESLI